MAWSGRAEPGRWCLARGELGWVGSVGWVMGVFIFKNEILMKEIAVVFGYGLELGTNFHVAGC